jgi:hypothetical protein
MASCSTKHPHRLARVRAKPPHRCRSKATLCLSEGRSRATSFARWPCARAGHSLCLLGRSAVSFGAFHHQLAGPRVARRRGLAGGRLCGRRVPRLRGAPRPAVRLRPREAGRVIRSAARPSALRSSTLPHPRAARSQHTLRPTHRSLPPPPPSAHSTRRRLAAAHALRDSGSDGGGIAPAAARCAPWCC